MAARRRPLRTAVRLAGWLVAAAVAAVLALQLWFLVQVVWLRYEPPGHTAFMRAQLEVLREADPRAQLAHRWVPYARVSANLKRAVIAAEDARFAAHDGVDWRAIEEAHARNQRRGRITHGGSTITMQLAKNLFLSGERSYLRKAQELVITYMLEAVLTKDRILELYLNLAEWGSGVFGCEAAARRYFGVSAAQLSPQQAARLAAMLPRPRFYERQPGSPVLAARAAAIQRWMASVELP
jgi:monofunctional biosynthetic peptidoglycan transglycosylase